MDGNQNLFDTLSIFSQQKILEIEETSNIESLKDLNIIQGTALFEFSDYINLSLYNSRNARACLGSRKGKMLQKNTIFFNNLVNVIAVTLHIESKNFMLKVAYTP